MDLTDQVFFICNQTDTMSSLQVYGQFTISYSALTTLTCSLTINLGGSVSVQAGTFDIQTSVSVLGLLNITINTKVLHKYSYLFFDIPKAYPKEHLLY